MYRNKRNPCASPAVVTASKEQLWVVHCGDIIGFLEKVKLNFIILSGMSRLVNLEGFCYLVVLTCDKAAAHAFVSIHSRADNIAVKEVGWASFVC